LKRSGEILTGLLMRYRVIVFYFHFLLRKGVEALDPWDVGPLLADGDLLPRFRKVLVGNLIGSADNAHYWAT
jgi:hypothetical protein